MKKIDTYIAAIIIRRIVAMYLIIFLLINSPQSLDKFY